MAILDILHFPDPRLRTVAQPVTEVDASLRQLIDDMLETMYKAPGIGLAATQVNVDKRVVVIDVSEEKERPLCLINPEILELSGTEEMEEGCLSVPGHWWEITRPAFARVKALDLDGNEVEYAGDGLLGRVLQHEVAHLDGGLLIDALSRRERKKALKELRNENLGLT